MTLTSKVFSAGFWHSLAFALAKLLSLVRLAVLARLLSHEEFGLMALVVLAVSSLWTLSDAGVNAAVVQKQRPDAKWLHTAWHLNWMRGVLLGALCWSIATPVAWFFHEARLESLIHWAALIPLIHGFMSLGYTLMQKTLDFKMRAFVDLSKELVFTVVAICIALFWQADVLALLLGLIAGTVAAVVTSYLLHDYRPQIGFSWPYAREIWRFGLHLMGVGILVFLITNLDDAVVGRMLGMEKLGQYSMAFMLAGIITSQLVQLLNSILFPAMSGVQEDIARMQRILSYTLRLVIGILTPITLLVFLTPGLLIQTAVGEQWLVIAPAFVILVAMGWMRGVVTVFGPTLLALGRSNIMHRIKWIEFILFAVCIVPAVMFFGIEGAALTLLLGYTMSLILNVRAVTMLLGSIKPALQEGLKAVVPSIIAFVVAAGLSVVVYPWTYGEWFVSGIFILTWGMVFFFRERGFLGMLWTMRKA